MLAVFADDLGMTQEMAFKIGEGLSGGFGARKELCGAVNAMGIVLSLKNSGGIDSNHATKQATCSMIDRATEIFIEKNGSHICKPLRDENTEIRTCDTLILDCIEITEMFLNEE